jgi:hypothetical protein
MFDLFFASPFAAYTESDGTTRPIPAVRQRFNEHVQAPAAEEEDAADRTATWYVLQERGGKTNDMIFEDFAKDLKSETVVAPCKQMADIEFHPEVVQSFSDVLRASGPFGASVVKKDLLRKDPTQGVGPAVHAQVRDGSQSAFCVIVRRTHFFIFHTTCFAVRFGTVICCTGPSWYPVPDGQKFAAAPPLSAHVGGYQCDGAI